MQIGHVRPHIELTGDLSGDRGGQSIGEECAGNALGDRTREQAGSPWHGEQRGDAAAAGGLPEHGDVVRVAAERGDVVLYPSQGGDLVEESAVVRGSGEMCEAFCPDAVVEAHHHHAGGGQGGAVVVGVGGVAFQVATAMDPHHDRQPRGTKVG